MPPQSLKGVGFMLKVNGGSDARGKGSFWASEDYVLFSTLKRIDPGLQAGLAACAQELSRTANCRQLYEKQRLWALDVIAFSVLFRKQIS